MKLKTNIILSMVCGFLATTAVAQNGADLLQKALRKEQIEGDLKGSIELYRQIATEKSSSRALAAQALILLGKAYEKLGAGEARGAYEKVIREFSDQSKEVTEARTRLGKLEKETK